MTDEQYIRAIAAAYRAGGLVRLIDLAAWYARINDGTNLLRLRAAAAAIDADRPT